MAVKLNEKSKKWFVYGKYKDAKGNYKNYKKQTSFTSKKKAQEYDKKLKKELDSNIYYDHGMTFFQLIDLYIIKKKLAINTIRNYEKTKRALKNDFYLSQVNVRFINQKILPTIHKELVKNVRAVLRYAYIYQYIDINVHSHIDSEKIVRNRKIELFDSKLICEDKNFHFSNGVELNDLIYFILESGLRLNEMLSITFDCIKEDVIHIHRQLIRDAKNHRYSWENVKSKASKRDVVITPKMREIIDKQPFVEGGFLFGGAKFMEESSPQKHIRENYNTHFHALRHTHASHLIEYSYEVLGYCNKDHIAKHMGHTVEVLEKTYKHLFKDKNNDILKVLKYINEKD